jgi:co-chaperonin GroES (HSP10)
MIKPRNTLVLVKLIEKKELKIGQITVPDFDDLYSEAEVLAVGPGSAAGVSQTETFDLQKGQRVWIQTKRKMPGGLSRLEGIRYVEGGESFYLFEQMNVLGIIAEPA